MAKKRTFQGSPQAKKEREEANELLLKSYALVRRAQYKKSFEVTVQGIKDFPNNRFAQYRYAVMLGDSEEWASPALHKKNTKKAAALLRSLLRRSSGIDPSWIKSFKNEYYWFSRQPLKQWRLGVSEVRKKAPSGYYSMGVGAVSLSLNHYKSKKERVAKKWAEKAIDAWKHYFRFSPDYYNAHVWYAQALGLAGDLPAMEKALKNAAKLAKRPLSYREFVDARKAVLEALGKAQKAR